MVLVLIVKGQGEERERGADGKLHATQEAWLRLVIAVDGHLQWWGPRAKTIGQCQAKAEALVGKLDWRGFPAFLEITGELRNKEIEIKAAAEWKRSVAE